MIANLFTTSLYTEVDKILEKALDIRSLKDLKFQP